MLVSLLVGMEKKILGESGNISAHNPMRTTGVSSTAYFIGVFPEKNKKMIVNANE